GGRGGTVAVVLVWMVGEREAAQPIYSNRDGGPAAVRFAGSAEMVTFVRPALGYEARAGLDDITYSLGQAGTDRAIIRARRDHLVGTGGEDLPLVRGDLMLTLRYAGRE